ncbi:MAG: hypothetical protein DWQ29_00565 [Planctomycetota bacterium]|nr:MAG: hypothetical protein DWQ29_00565 [Planctomycetota bacterium]
MPRRTRDYRRAARGASQRGMVAALLLIWLGGAGLTLAPAAVDDALRSVISDGLAPGCLAAACVQRRVEECFANDAQTADQDEIVRVKSELDAWRRRCLELQHRCAALSAKSAGDADLSLDYRPTEGPPLLIPELLRAEVIGDRSDALRSRLAKLVDRGTTGGVAVDDLVLADEAIHVDQGSLSGVSEDMPVFAGRTIVGRIARAGQWTSTIQAVSDPEFRGYGQIIRRSPHGPVLGAKGVVAGNGDGTCRLELIPVTEPVSVGDDVYTATGVGQDRQRLHYGRIIAADYESTSGYWSITLESHHKLESLASVEILREILNPTRFADSPESTTRIEPTIQQVGGFSEGTTREQNRLVR